METIKAFIFGVIFLSGLSAFAESNSIQNTRFEIACQDREAECNALLSEVIHKTQNNLTLTIYLRYMATAKAPGCGHYEFYYTPYWVADNYFLNFSVNRFEYNSQRNSLVFDAAIPMQPSIGGFKNSLCKPALDFISFNSTYVDRNRASRSIAFPGKFFQSGTAALPSLTRLILEAKGRPISVPLKKFGSDDDIEAMKSILNNLR